ncbi:MAG TPA: LysR family transcriptional regulator [Acidimicrobiales bacterium]|nr:LysR family transcriptional regulator [Acidimicrobiales bacterium]
MELRQLSAILALAEHGTFSAAADALGTVQSNVSTHIARLERELGTPLFDRSRGALTEEGKVVVDRARRMMVEMEALVADVAAVRNVVAGTVSLGMIGTTARWLAPKVLEEMGREHPGVHLSVAEGTSAELADRLQAGRLDLAVSSLPSADEDLNGEGLFDEDLVLVVARHDPLAGRTDISVEELCSIPLLLPMQGTTLRRELETALGQGRDQPVALTPKADIDGVRLIASLTFDGHGPAILPACAVPDYLHDRWVTVAVEGLPRRTVGVVTRHRGLLSAPARAVRDLLRDIVAEQVGTGARSGLHPPSSAGRRPASGG